MVSEGLIIPLKNALLAFWVTSCIHEEWLGRIFWRVQKHIRSASDTAIAKYRAVSLALEKAFANSNLVLQSRGVRAETKEKIIIFLEKTRAWHKQFTTTGARGRDDFDETDYTPPPIFI